MADRLRRGPEAGHERVASPRLMASRCSWHVLPRSLIPRRNAVVPRRARDDPASAGARVTQTLEAATEVSAFLNTQANAARAIIDRAVLRRRRRSAAPSEHEVSAASGRSQVPAIAARDVPWWPMPVSPRPGARSRYCRGVLAMVRGGTYTHAAGLFRYSVSGSCPTSRRCSTTRPDSCPRWRLWHRTRATPSSPNSLTAATARFLTRDLARPTGGFFSALDADTDGVEGVTGRRHERPGAGRAALALAEASSA